MASPRRPDFETLIAAIARHLGAGGIPFMLIGGQAVLLHGRPRLTEDVDITLGVEDLIIHKLFAGRPRDLEDAVGVVRRSGPRLDWTYVNSWVAEFAQVPGREDLPTRLAQVRQEGDT